jgi:hypothetical protein
VAVTVIVKVAVAPAAKLPSVQLTADGAVAPTDGFVHENAGPVFCTKLTKVLPVGTMSVSVVV